MLLNDTHFWSIKTLYYQAFHSATLSIVRWFQLCYLVYSFHDVNRHPFPDSCRLHPRSLARFYMLILINNICIKNQNSPLPYPTIRNFSWFTWTFSYYFNFSYTLLTF